MNWSQATVDTGEDDVSTGGHFGVCCHFLLSLVKNLNLLGKIGHLCNFGQVGTRKVFTVEIYIHL